MPREIIVSGQKYRIGVLDVFDQFHVSRHLSPMLVKSVEALKEKGMKVSDFRDMNASLDEKIDLFLNIADSFTVELSTMDEKSVNFILNTCLEACMRYDSGAWAQVKAKKSPVMYKDIQMFEMMQLVFAVIKENMSDFFQKLDGSKANADQPSAETSN